MMHEKKTPLKSESSQHLKVLAHFLMAIAVIFIISGISLWIQKHSLLPHEEKRTIMIYMVGSDLESDYNAATKDMKEMILSGADFEKVNLLIYTGGAKNWHTEGIDNDKNTLLKISENGIEKLEELDMLNMGTPSGLTYLLEYGYNHYPADHYSLILWDHGGGPIYGYGYDEYYKRDSLLLAEIQSALQKSPFQKENKLEFIGFDACLMASIEVANGLSDYTDYLIASQEVEPGEGWDYSFLSTITEKSSTEEIAKSVIDRYHQYYESKLNKKGTTLSLLDLTKVNEVENKLNELFYDVEYELNLQFSNISRIRSTSKSFGKTTSNTINYDLVDLYDLAENLKGKYREKVESLQSSINDIVLYQKTDLTNTHGISIYFPYENKTNIKAILNVYQNFQFAEEYTRFITNFASKLTGTRLHDWDLTKEMPVSLPKNEIEVTIPEEVAQNYSKASYILFERQSDNSFIPRFTGSDVTLEGNTLSTTITNKALVATDSKGEKTSLSLLEKERGEDYVKYMLPATVQTWDDELFTNPKVVPVSLEFVVDKEHPNGVISEGVALLEEEETLTLPKSTINLEDWKWIQLWNFQYQILDENGNYQKNWIASPTVTGFEANIEEGFTLQLEDLDTTKEYYVLFSIQDSQGNTYETNITKINNE